jgi:predicted dehydrogenase
MIDGGRLGKISLLMEVFIGGQGSESYRDLGPAHYPVGGPGGGGMGLMDHGIHLVDIFRWFAGSEPKAVTGRGNFSGGPPQAEFLTMIFENGAVGQLVYNETTYSSDTPYEGIFSWGGGWDVSGNLLRGGGWNAHPGSIRIHGDLGALRIFYYANKLFITREGGQEQVRIPDHPMPANFALQMESFVKNLRQGREPEVTGLDGLRSLQLVLAAYESFATSKTVKIEPPNP